MENEPSGNGETGADLLPSWLGAPFRYVRFLLDFDDFCRTIRESLERHRQTGFTDDKDLCRPDQSKSYNAASS